MVFFLPQFPFHWCAWLGILIFLIFFLLFWFKQVMLQEFTSNFVWCLRNSFRLFSIGRLVDSGGACPSEESKRVYGKRNCSNNDRGMYLWWCYYLNWNNYDGKLFFHYVTFFLSFDPIIMQLFLFSVLGEGKIPISCYSKAWCLAHCWWHNQGSPYGYFPLLFKYSTWSWSS